MKNPHKLLALSVIALLSAVVATAQDSSRINTSSGAGVSQKAAPNQNLIYVSPNCGTQANCAAVYADTQMNSNAGHWTSTSHAVSCSSCTFTSADIGKEITGFSGNSNPCGSGYGYPVSPTLPETTIATFVDSHDITTTAAATGTATTGCLFWGHVDDTGLSAADTLFQSAFPCPTLVLPKGIMWIDSPHFHTAPSSCTNGMAGWSGAAGGGPRITGFGQFNTMLFMGPTFAIGSCPANGCFNGIAGSSWDQLSIFGGNNTAAGGSSGVTLFGIAIDDQLSYVALIGFGNANGEVTGATVLPGAWAKLDHVQLDGFGGRCLYADGISLNIANSSVADCVLPSAESFGSEMTVESGVVTSSNTQYDGHPNDATNNTLVYVENATQFFSIDDETLPNGATAAETGIYNNGGTVFISRDQLPGTSSSNLRGFGQGAGSSTISGTLFQSTNITLSMAGGSFVDGCGNSGISAHPGTISGTVFGSCSITGTAQLTSNITPSAGFGTGAAVSVTCTGCVAGDSHRFVFQVTNGSSGTGANPTVTVVFPTPFLAAPVCQLPQQLGGTNALLTPISLSALPTSTGFTMQVTGTPTASDTELFSVACQ